MTIWECNLVGVYSHCAEISQISLSLPSNRISPSGCCWKVPVSWERALAGGFPCNAQCGIASGFSGQGVSEFPSLIGCPSAHIGLCVKGTPPASGNWEIANQSNGSEILDMRRCGWIGVPVGRALDSFDQKGEESKSRLRGGQFYMQAMSLICQVSDSTFPSSKSALRACVGAQQKSMQTTWQTLVKWISQTEMGENLL